ncbi:hypothetical protein EXN66_Car014135 [Channa argus]|uniref:Ig-like domain-containing protein n=1 Tax=Channa argus TaxID=215402 RepID=A0A6G1Q7R4_CHAAH|nr:hypothetical protein EXN66_Car014135 [Channa argus]
MSGLTVSAVPLNVSPNLQQFFTRGPPVSLSCVEDGQTVDGWTVKTTRGGQIEECGAAGSDFGRLDGSSCVLDVSTKFSTDHWCESSSGQRSDQVTITVTDKDLILEIPALPVLTGSDVTLSCRNRNGDKVKAYFYKNGKVTEDKLQRVQQSDEGLYSCFTDEDGKSADSRLRVRDPPPTSAPQTTTSSTTTTVYAATSFNDNNNNTDARASFSPPLSLIRLFLHVMVFCPYSICTILMVSICYSRKTGNKPVFSMEMTQCDDQYDDIIDNITTNHFRAAQM